MSIISDALRKAQSKRGSRQQNKDLSWITEITETPNETRSARKGKIKKILIALNFVLFVLIAVLLIRHHGPLMTTVTLPPTAETEAITEEEPLPAEIDQISSPPNVAPQEEPQPQSEPAAPKSGSHQMPIFSGVMYMDNEPRAILDGRSFGVGEFVHGLEVKSISSDRVVLSDSSSEFTLRLH